MSYTPCGAVLMVALACYVCLLPPSVHADYAISSTIRSGRLWRNEADIFHPVVTKGWNYNAALLACQDLGFGPPSDYERTIRSKGARLGKHTAAGLTDASLSRYFDSSCVGELPSCAVPTFTSRKSESIANLQQVVLRCNEKPLEPRLVTGNDVTGLHYGFVQLQQEGQFRYVCGQDWGNEQSDVVCRELGYPTGRALVPGKTYNLTGVTTVVPQYGEQGLVRGVQCSGAGSHLSLCPHVESRAWESVPCASLAAVECTKPDPASVAVPLPADDAVPLPSGNSRLSTSVTSSLLWRERADGALIPVSAGDWNFNSALEACRSQDLGPPSDWEDTIRDRYERLSASSADPVFNNSANIFSVDNYFQASCLDSSCLTPSYNLLTTPAFNYIRHVRLNCFDNALPVRLITASGDTHKKYGLVELQHNNKYQRICGEGWSNKEANVVCRELGYGKGIALHDSLNISLVDRPLARALFREHGLARGLSCVGDEQHVSMCRHHQARSWETVQCTTLAGVVCGDIDMYTGMPATTQPDTESTAKTTDTTRGVILEGTCTETIISDDNVIIIMAAGGGVLVISLVLNLILLCLWCSKRGKQALPDDSPDRHSSKQKQKPQTRTASVVTDGGHGYVTIPLGSSAAASRTASTSEVTGDVKKTSGSEYVSGRTNSEYSI